MSFSKKFSEKNPFNQSPIKQQKEELGLWDQFKANIAENLDPYNYQSEESRLEEAKHDSKASLSEDPTSDYKLEKALHEKSPELYKDYWELGEKAAEVKDVIGRVADAGLGNAERDNIYKKALQVNEETGEVTYGERNKQSVHERKDLMSILMGTPQQFNSIEKSQYQPSNSTDPNAVYYRSKATEETLKKQYNVLLDYFSETGKDKAVTYAAGEDDSWKSNVLGRYTVSKGIDDDGREYLSYYDKWDLQPFKESGFLTSITDKLQDFAGLNAPEVYGRVYKDEIGEETWQDKMENKNSL